MGEEKDGRTPQIHCNLEIADRTHNWEATESIKFRGRELGDFRALWTTGGSVGNRGCSIRQLRERMVIFNL